MKRGVKSGFLIFSIALIVFVFSFVPNTPAPSGSACNTTSDCNDASLICQSGYCSYSTSSCSSSNYWYCYTRSECEGAGAKWCDSSSGSGWCTSSSSTCPSTTCDSSNYWNCNTESTCTSSGGKWCQGSSTTSSWCTSSSSTCPSYTCDAANYWNCNTETTCTSSGGRWCNSYCMSSSSTCPSSGSCTSCSTTCTSFCNSQAQCDSIGGKYCSYVCYYPASSLPSACSNSSSGGGGGGGSGGTSCSSSQYWYCYDKSSCENTGSKWCGSYCSSSSCPTCSSTQVWNCYDESSCTSASGNWCKGSGGGSGWCSSYTCPSTTCDKNNPWNCYDESSCTSASGNWCKGSYGSSNWCSMSSCPSYTCSKDSTWYCYTESECKGANAQWCGSYCSFSSCPTCSSTQKWNCYTETDCKTASGNWCKSSYGGSGWCTDSCPTCDSNQPWNCYTESDCKTASGNWCSSNPKYPPVSSWCSSSTCSTYACDSSGLWNCDNENDCKTASGEWCKYSSTSTYGPNGYCSSSCPKCSSTQTWNCYSEDECKTAAGKWCKSPNSDYGWCSTSECPSTTCDKNNPWNCYDESSCTSTGANWCKNTYTNTYYTASTATPSYSGWCSSYKCPSIECEKNSPWNCYTKDKCTSAGAQWCGTYCSTSCPVCSTSQPWNCYDKNECASANGQWCGNYCSSSCPTCSSTQKWNCYSEEDCKSSSGEWCKSSYGNGWCSDSCPTCSSTQLWNCYDEKDCKNAKGNWCGTYCSSYECPKCDSSRPWNCYTKSDCSTSGGNWCGTWCSSYECPSVCGNNVCEPGESAAYCKKDCSDNVECPQRLVINFNKFEYSVGEEVEMTIEAGQPNVPVDITANVDKASFGTFSLTTDSGGKITNKFKVNEFTPGGIYKIEAKSQMPNCNSVSDSKSVTINAKGYCGDKICSAEESQEKCPADCTIGTNENYCPSTKQCADGKTVSCNSYNNACYCEPCEIEDLPSDCKQVKDQELGILRIECNSTCPPPPPDISNMKDQCVKNGGNPVFKNDYNDCNYFYCDFAGQESFYTGSATCFSENEVEEISAKCAKLGLPLQVNLEGDCKVASCVQKDINSRCTGLLYSDYSKKEAECKLQGLDVIKNFGNNSCEALECGTPNQCMKSMPDLIYTECSQKGGELIIRKDFNDCITTSECVYLNDERDVSIEDISQLPSKADLEDSSLKLEKLLNSLNKLYDAAVSIKAYYNNLDDSRQEIWDRVTIKLRNIIDEIDTTKSSIDSMLEQDELSKDDVLKIKSQIKKITNFAFDDILFMITSKSNDEITEKKDFNCNEDFSCFDRRARLCEITSFNPDSNTNVRISGIEDDACLIEVQLDEKAGPAPGTLPDVNPPYTMTCKVKNFANGIDDPESDLLPFCEGSLVEIINSYIGKQVQERTEMEIESEMKEATSEEQAYKSVTGSVIMYLEENKGPKDCFGWQDCSKLCNKEPYTCVAYIDSWLKRNPGPGNVRAYSELLDFCSENQQSCTEWMLSRGFSLQSIDEAKQKSVSPITSFAIRR